MKNKFVFSILGLSTLFISVTSCTKDDDEKDQPTCRINNIVETVDNTTISRVLEYDEGKLSAVKTAGGDGVTKLFTYTSGMITITSKNRNGALTGTEEVTLNQSEKIASIRQKDALGTTTNITTYVYNNDGTLNMFYTNPTIGIADTTRFTYHNGNATVSTNDGKNTLYDYYSDKTYLDGDFIKISQVINTGALALVNKNLLKSVTSSDGKVTTFDYQYNNTGRITRLIISGATSRNFSYTYDCE